MSFSKPMSVPEGKGIEAIDMLALITDMEVAAGFFGETTSDSACMMNERNQDRSGLLEAAKKLVEALEDPRKTALEIAKWVGTAGNPVGKTWLTVGSQQHMPF